jgi:hypothetical protein
MTNDKKHHPDRDKGGRENQGPGKKEHPGKPRGPTRGGDGWPSRSPNKPGTHSTGPRRGTKE